MNEGIKKYLPLDLKTALWSLIFGSVSYLCATFWLNPLAQRRWQSPDVEVVGVMPIHLSTRRPKDDRNFRGYNHKLVFIIKLKNSSSTEANSDFSLIRGCIGVSPMEIDGHLSRKQRLFYKRKSIPQDTLNKLLDRRKNAVQRISISGFVKGKAVVSGHDTDYIGVEFPLSGAIFGEVGSVSLEGRCEEIEVAHTMAQLFDLFEWKVRHIGRIPTGLASEFYSGQLKMSLQVGNELLEVDSKKITQMYHVSNRDWNELSLSLMYENPDIRFPPVRQLN